MFIFRPHLQLWKILLLFARLQFSTVGLTINVKCLISYIIILVNLLSNIVTALLTTSTTLRRPNWYALVKSCINVNHYVLLVRRHLKYVCFTKFTKFWGEVKNGPSLGISKNKKAFPLTPRPGALPLDPAGDSAPDPRAFPQLQICHYTTGQVLWVFECNRESYRISLNWLCWMSIASQHVFSV